MQIDTNTPVGTPVGTPVQGLESTPKAGAVTREKEEKAEQSPAETEATPDYQLSLSEESKKAVAVMNGPQPANASPTSDLGEQEAVQVASQAAAQLAQTNATISNQAIQKAIDLFT